MPSLNPWSWLTGALGSAAKSPITQTVNEGVVSLSALYKF